jgi:amino acid transporter
VRSDDERLLGNNDYLDVSASPFVIAAVNAGIPGFGDFINAIILLAVISIGLSGVYGGSRTLTALAEQGYAPSIFGYIDRAGRPIVSTMTIIAFGPLAYVALASSGAIVFSWLLALSGLAALFTWGSICAAHIRFRQAWKYHGHTLDELPFRAPFGVWGSWIGLLIILLILIAQVSATERALRSRHPVNISTLVLHRSQADGCVHVFQRILGALRSACVLRYRIRLEA